MSLGVWMGSESVWECTYLYQICWQRNHIRSWHSDIVFYSCALYCIKTPMPGDVWIVSAGCLDGVCGCLDHILGCVVDVLGSIDAI